MFERRDSVLERLPQHPALAIGEGVKRFDDLGAGLDIKLYVPARLVAPRLPAK